MPNSVPPPVKAAEVHYLYDIGGSGYGMSAGEPRRIVKSRKLVLTPRGEFVVELAGTIVIVALGVVCAVALAIVRHS